MNAITINGRYLLQRVTGVQRFGREVLSNLIDKNDSSNTGNLEVLVPNSANAEIDIENKYISHLGRLNGHAWEQLELSRTHPDNVIVNLCNTAPVFRRRQLVVLHDVMVAAMPSNFTFTFRTWYKAMISSYLRNSAQIATVSKFSAREISKHFGIPESRIAIIPESGEHILRVTSSIEILDKLGIESDKYFLAVSSSASNKNFSAVVSAADAMQRTDFKFVIVGGGNARVFGDGGPVVASATVVKAGYVSDSELRALYENAACFVYPSLYEGFGLPPLEAMSCGCPVIVADSSSLPEVCGNAAVYCDPHNTQSLLRALTRVLDNPQLRAELRIQGVEQSSLWRWHDAANTIKSLTESI